MRRRVIAAAALALVAGAACGGGGTESDAGGHLRVERRGSRTATLMDEPGRADYCAAETLLTIIAIGHNRAAGFAVRTAFPLREPRTFVVQSVLGGLGTATAAFRLVNGSARLGAAGSLRLEPSPGIEGEFEVTVPDSAGTPVEFRGKVSRIPIRSGSRESCPGA